jgi:hypothetical protein
MTVISGMEKMPQYNSRRLSHNNINVTSGVCELPLSLILSDGYIERAKVCFIDLFQVVLSFFPLS